MDEGPSWMQVRSPPIQEPGQFLHGLPAALGAEGGGATGRRPCPVLLSAGGGGAGLTNIDAAHAGAGAVPTWAH